MAAHVPRKPSAMETLLEPSLHDVKKEKKMYGYDIKRRQAVRYGGLVFKTLGSAIDSIGMRLTGSRAQIHLNVFNGADREQWFVCLVGVLVWVLLVTDRMGSLYVVREFVDDLQSVVQLPNSSQQQLLMEVQGSCSCSVLQSKPARKNESSFFQCPHICLQ